MNPLHHLATSALVTLIVATLAVPHAHAVTIDWVTVGNSGNAWDTYGGKVTYSYQIAKYNVTIGQYAEFLNAVAVTDTYGLYDTRMGTDLRVAGIARSGGLGSYAYSVMNNAGDSTNRPIAWVSWLDAARFANWMQNGQPNGAQGNGTTETGAYNLGGMMSGTAPAKNVGAQFYIPTENEWYKSAYYDPTLNSGTGGYWGYATQSNTAPGNFVGSLANQANYVANGVFSVTQSGSYSASQNYLTNVGAFTNSSSYYGTFDQNGNVFQWYDDGNGGSGTGFRGGSWGSSEGLLATFSRAAAVSPSTSSFELGFRLAAPVAVPEPSTYVMALAGLACGGYSMFRRRKRA